MTQKPEFSSEELSFIWLVIGDFSQYGFMSNFSDLPGAEFTLNSEGQKRALDISKKIAAAGLPDPTSYFMEYFEQE